MIYLVFEILFHVIAAAVLGFMAAWLIRGGSLRRLKRETEALKARLAEVEAGKVQAANAQEPKAEPLAVVEAEPRLETQSASVPVAPPLAPAAEQPAAQNQAAQNPATRIPANGSPAGEPVDPEETAPGRRRKRRGPGGPKLSHRILPRNGRHRRGAKLRTAR